MAFVHTGTINTDYPLEAMDVLLNQNCLAERYYPLLLYKELLLRELPLRGCKIKSDAEKLPDAVFTEIGIPDAGMLRLFRRFLALYDPKPTKFREIPKVTSDQKERDVFRELYHLPGVKAVRAALYYRSGFRSLSDFAEATPEEVLTRTAGTVTEFRLSCIAPLPKEVRTHIAVAKAFLWE